VCTAQSNAEESSLRAATQVESAELQLQWVIGVNALKCRGWVGHGVESPNPGALPPLPVMFQRDNAIVGTTSGGSPLLCTRCDAPPALPG
jgi:hypothetical protein